MSDTPSTDPATAATKTARTASGTRRRPAGKKASPKAAARKPAATPRKAEASAAAPKPAKAAKPAKPKKPKLVRDSYTIPKDEYAVLAQLKERCKALERAVKKSELLRAGLRALAAMSDKALHAAVQAVPPLKTGRPRKS